MAARVLASSRGRLVEAGSLGVLLLLAVLVPWCVDAHAESTFAGLRRGAANDEAVLELAAHDALRGEALPGAYSRFGWHHPGPLPIQLLGLGVALLGSHGPHWIVALLNLGCLLAALVLVARRHAPSIRAMFVVFVALASAAFALHVPPPSSFFSIWNPAVAFFPLLLLWTLAVESPHLGRWAPPVATLVHAYVVQAHVGYALVASFLWLACFVQRGGRRDAMTWALTAIVAALAWSRSIETWPNLLAIARFLHESPEVGITWVDALYLAAQRTQEPLLRVFVDEVSDPLALTALGAQVLLLLDRLARAHRVRGVARTAGIALGTLVVSVGSVRGVDSLHHVHQTFWLLLVGPLAWWVALSPWLARRPLRVTAIALAVMLALAASRADRAHERYLEWAHGSAWHARAHRTFADAVAAHLERGPVELAIARDEANLWGVAAAVAAELEGRGRTVQLDAALAFMFGPARTTALPATQRLMLARRVIEGWQAIAHEGDLYLLEPARHGALHR
jgi:hypothetical protein